MKKIIAALISSLLISGCEKDEIIDDNIVDHDIFLNISYLSTDNKTLIDIGSKLFIYKNITSSDYNHISYINDGVVSLYGNSIKPDTSIVVCEANIKINKTENAQYLIIAESNHYFPNILSFYISHNAYYRKINLTFTPQ